jgi:hypothetical protein
MPTLDPQFRRWHDALFFRARDKGVASVECPPVVEVVIHLTIESQYRVNSWIEPRADVLRVSPPPQ